MQKITRVPTSQFYFKGVINLRGEVIPVMSIRRKMGLEDDVYTGASRIIILKFEQKDALGIVVDEVKEVINLGSDEIDKLSHSSREEKKCLLMVSAKMEMNLFPYLILMPLLMSTKRFKRLSMFVKCETV